jgi:hypothetical protein
VLSIPLEYRSALGFRGTVPKPFALNKTFDAVFFDFPQVFLMGIAMHLVQRVEFLAFFEFHAFPAALNTFFLHAFSDGTKRVPSAVSAALSASEFNHGAQDFVAFLVVLEFFAEP